MPCFGSSFPPVADANSPAEEWTERRIPKQRGYAIVDVKNNKMNVVVRGDDNDIDQFELEK